MHYVSKHVRLVSDLCCHGNKKCGRLNTKLAIPRPVYGNMSQILVPSCGFSRSASFMASFKLAPDRPLLLTIWIYIGYNSACIGDKCQILVPKWRLSGIRQCNHSNWTPTDPCFHGNEILACYYKSSAASIKQWRAPITLAMPRFLVTK